MITVSTKKTTRINTTINWRSEIKDENGNVFATMSATADEHRPLGSATLNVVHSEIYNNNIEQAQAEYKKFQAAIIDECKSISFAEIITD